MTQEQQACVYLSAFSRTFVEANLFHERVCKELAEVYSTRRRGGPSAFLSAAYEDRVCGMRSQEGAATLPYQHLRRDGQDTTALPAAAS